MGVSRTAFRKYQRLEASGLWRPRPDEQRREVIVSIGEATLIVTDLRDRPLTHWSLAAIERLNPGETPALFHPEGDPGETIELAPNETEMIAAIETLRQVVGRGRDRPGRLRLWGGLASAAAVLAIAIVWLPGALRSHAVSVVPEIKREEIGAALLDRIERVSGPACTLPQARPALARLAARLDVGRLVVVPGGIRDALHLPGGVVVLNRALVEDYEQPDVAAGYVVAETARADREDPLAALLRIGGPGAALRLLTTGDVGDETLDAYAEHLVADPPAPLGDEALLAAFGDARVPSTPYARARDVTGETVLGLIEADPMAGSEAAPILPDRDWVLLQSICER